MAYYSAIKKNEFMKFLGKWMDLEGIILSEVTQSQKNSHDIYSLMGPVIHPIADYEHSLLCLLAPRIASQETAISGSFLGKWMDLESLSFRRIVPQVLVIKYSSECKFL